MQGAPAERFWQLYVSPGSSSFRLNLAKEPAVTLPRTGPAPSESERSSRGRITTLAKLDIFSADERMSWNSSLGKRVYSRRRQTFDARYHIGKNGEGRKIGVDILIQEEKRFSHLQSCYTPLTGYVCALGPMLSVRPVSLVISKYGYMGLAKHLKTYEPSANWSGVPTHSIIWTPNTLELQTSVKETKHLIPFQRFHLSLGTRGRYALECNSGSEETLHLPTAIPEPQNITCLLKLSFPLVPPFPSLINPSKQSA